MSKKTLYSTLLLALAMPLAVFAQNCGPDGTVGYIACWVAQEVVVVGSWIVVIMWVVTGILFLTAQGDPGKLNAAKMGLFAAIGGTILIIISQGAVTFVKNSFRI